MTRFGFVPFLLAWGVFAAGPNVFMAYSQGAKLVDADARSIESALAANPEDQYGRAELLGY